MACSKIMYDAAISAEDVLESIASSLFKKSTELTNLLEEGEKIFEVTITVKEMDDDE